MKPFKGIKELVRGLQITGKHLGRHAITIQYPEERWTMPERSRGIVVLLSDKETGELNCTACLLCEKACPTAAIRIDAPRHPETKKRELKSFVVNHGLCCFCGLCEEACNFSAIKMATKYEFSSESRVELVWDMKKLQDIGRDVPYVDVRKKKKEAAKAAKAKAAPPKPEKAEQEKPSVPPKPESPSQAAEDNGGTTSAEKEQQSLKLGDERRQDEKEGQS